MTTLVKTVPASELPPGWQAELGLSDGDMVRVEMQDIRAGKPAETEAERRARLLRSLHAIVPVKIAVNSTEFIRAERDRIDGRDK